MKLSHRVEHLMLCYCVRTVTYSYQLTKKLLTKIVFFLKIWRVLPLHLHDKWIDHISELFIHPISQFPLNFLKFGRKLPLIHN